MYTRIKTLYKNRAEDNYRRAANITMGLLATLLPIVLISGHNLISDSTALLPSVSHYYYTDMGIFFITALSIFAAFLFITQTNCSGEKRWTMTAAIGTLGTICLPTMPVGSKLNVIYTLHLFFALSLFLAISILAIRYYSKTGVKKTDRMFQWAGIGILSSLIVLILFFIIITAAGGHTVDYNVVLYIEAVMITLLGSVWILRGSLIKS